MASSKQKGTTPATPQDIVGDAYTAMTANQREAFDALVSLPATASAQRRANIVAAPPKAFRGWVRSVLHISVTGKAEGCDRTAFDADADGTPNGYADTVRIVQRWVRN